MQKILFIIAAISYCTSTSASTKCVALDTTGTTACTNTTATSGKPNWSAKCPYNDTTVDVQGVAICGSESNCGVGMPMENPNIGSGTHCFCKMITPVQSQWIAICRLGNSAEDCSANCASECAKYMSGADSLSQDLRKWMFKSLI